MRLCAQHSDPRQNCAHAREPGVSSELMCFAMGQLNVGLPSTNHSFAGGKAVSIENQNQQVNPKSRLLVSEPPLSGPGLFFSTSPPPSSAQDRKPSQSDNQPCSEHSRPARCTVCGAHCRRVQAPERKQRLSTQNPCLCLPSLNPASTSSHSDNNPMP